MKKYLGITLVFVAFPAVAQMVPPIERIETASVAPMFEETPTQIQLTAKDKAALEIARQWRNNPDKPRRSGDGTVMYLYGATLPTIICTPLQVCSVSLEAGEIVNDVNLGDSARWKVIPAQQGAGASAITKIIVKPTDSGLTTNMIVTTDRRMYTILLKSAKHEWMNIGFDYPEQQERTWADYKAGQGRVANATTLATGEHTSALDFNFTMGGDNPKWKPQRIYTDGVKTYIQFPSSQFVDEAPALVAIAKGSSLWSDSTDQLINYRLIGDRYVVDGMPEKMALISGVGNGQTKVTIDYVGGKQK